MSALSPGHSLIVSPDRDRHLAESLVWATQVMTEGRCRQGFPRVASCLTKLRSPGTLTHPCACADRVPRIDTASCFIASMRTRAVFLFEERRGASTERRGRALRRFPCVGTV